MSVITKDYEEGFTTDDLETKDPDKTKVEDKKEEHNKFKAALGTVKEEVSKRINTAELAKQGLEAARNKINDMVDQLTATALGGLCGLIGLPNDFIDKILAKDMEIDAINARCDEEIASNEAHIAQYEYDIAILEANIEDYDRKAEINKTEAERQRALDPSIPEHLIDYPYYLDEKVYDKWVIDKTKYIKVRDQLIADNNTLKEKKTSWGEQMIEGAKKSAIGRKIKDAINTLKTSGTQIIKGVQLLIQNIVALFTEGIGAAVVAMGSGTVVSPSPASIISSKQKIAASAQALGTAISAMMVAAAELGLDGSLKDDGFPNIVDPLMPFATSLGIVAALA